MTWTRAKMFTGFFSLVAWRTSDGCGCKFLMSECPKLWSVLWILNYLIVPLDLKFSLAILDKTSFINDVQVLQANQNLSWMYSFVQKIIFLLRGCKKSLGVKLMVYLRRSPEGLLSKIIKWFPIYLIKSPKLT